MIHLPWSLISPKQLKYNPRYGSQLGSSPPPLYSFVGNLLASLRTTSHGKPINSARKSRHVALTVAKHRVGAVHTKSFQIASTHSPLLRSPLRRCPHPVQQMFRLSILPPRLQLSENTRDHYVRTMHKPGFLHTARFANKCRRLKLREDLISLRRIQCMLLYGQRSVALFANVGLTPHTSHIVATETRSTDIHSSCEFNF